MSIASSGSSTLTISLPLGTASATYPLTVVGTSTTPTLTNTATFSLVVSQPAETVTTPSVPAGPTSGLTTTAATFSTGGSVSNLGNAVQYKIFWGDGSDSGWLGSGVTSASHTWAAGTFSVTAQARTLTTLVSSALSTGSSITVTLPVESVTTPATPTGPASGLAGTSYTFSTSGAVSNFGNSIVYKFTWGDGTDSGWLSAGITSASHTWNAPGTFSVTAQARTINTLVASAVSAVKSFPVSDPVPILNSFTPGGNGLTQQFNLQARDYAGYGAVWFIDGLFNTSSFLPAQAGSCHFQYAAVNNTLWLDNSNANNIWVGSQTQGLGWSGTNSNGICQVNSWSASGSGQYLTLSISVTFQTTATWYEFMSAANATGVTPFATNGLTWVAAKTPNIPSGVTSVNAGTISTYTASGSTSASGSLSQVQYQFSWGDGTTSGWLPAGTTSASKSWSTLGTKFVTLQARSAVTPSVVSAVSSSLSVNVLETVTTPTQPSGSVSGLAGTNYTFSTGGSTSSVGNSVQYQFNWGDGQTSGWLPIGVTSASHTWTSTGTFQITAQAKSTSGTLSALSTAKSFSLSDPVPVLILFTPSGVGTTQTFTFQVQDYAGASAIQYIQPMFSPSSNLSSLNGGCHLEYVKSSNTLFLDSNSVNFSWVGSQPLGGFWSGSNSNGVCQVNSWSVSSSGQYLTLTVNLTFQTSRTFWEYLNATNATGNTIWGTNGLTWVAP